MYRIKDLSILYSGPHSKVQNRWHIEQRTKESFASEIDPVNRKKMFDITTSRKLDLKGIE